MDAATNEIRFDPMNPVPPVPVTHLTPAVPPTSEIGRSLAVLQTHWYWLLLAAFVGGAAAAVATLFLPSWFEATARLAVVPADDPLGLNTSNAIDGAGAVVPVLATMLQSRTVADEVIDRNDLRAVYHAPAIDAARAELMQHVNVGIDRKGNMLTITVEDQMPRRAVVIATSLAEVAVRRNTELWASRNREHRERLEARLHDVARELTLAEDAMRHFREENQVIDLPEQLKATVHEAAALEHLRIEKDLRLHFARGFGGVDAPEVVRDLRERRGAERALQGLLHDPQRRGPLLSLDRVPALEADYARLRREIDSLSARHELLARQVEQLRAAEARPNGRAEIVDPPTEPRMRSRPRRPRMCLGGAALGMCVCALGLLALFRRRDPAQVA
jgi:uncharacterized protein involved in exopolysaccharide biosynthesis